MSNMSQSRQRSNMCRVTRNAANIFRTLSSFHSRSIPFFSPGVATIEILHISSSISIAECTPAAQHIGDSILGPFGQRDRRRRLEASYNNNEKSKGVLQQIFVPAQDNTWVASYIFLF